MKQFMSDSDSLKGYYIGFNSFVFLGVHSTFKCFIFQPYELRSATERIFSAISEKAISSGVLGLRIRQDNIQYAAVHANVCMLRGIWPYSHCLQRRNPCQSRPLQAREVRRVKASAWNFELFPNPVFVMRIISRIHVDELRDLVPKDSGDDQTLNL